MKRDASLYLASALVAVVIGFAISQMGCEEIVRLTCEDSETRTTDPDTGESHCVTGVPCEFDNVTIQLTDCCDGTPISNADLNLDYLGSDPTAPDVFVVNASELGIYSILDESGETGGVCLRQAYEANATAPNFQPLLNSTIRFDDGLFAACMHPEGADTNCEF